MSYATEIPLGSPVSTGRQAGKLSAVRDYGHDTHLAFDIGNPAGDTVTVYRSRWTRATELRDGSWVIHND